MNIISALFIVLCTLSSTLYAAEVNLTAEDYVWRERFNERVKLARSGNAEAQFSIGEMYEKGSGVAANMKSAFAWFELAAKQKHQKAQFKIAFMYYRGEGVDANPAKAFQLMNQLATNGYARAQYCLALMYEAGVVTTRNLDQAHLWYSRAAAGGYTPAEEALAADAIRLPVQPVSPAPVETARAEPARQQSKIVQAPKAPTHASVPAAAPPVKTALAKTPPKITNLPSASSDAIAAALRAEAARGAQIALGLTATAPHLDLPSPPLTTVAGLQPIIPMQPTPPYSALTRGNWVSQTNLPVEFLPSKLTSCQPSNELANERAIVCVSKELIKTIGESQIGYKTESTVYAVQPTGEFKISYRNNIVKINRRRDGDSKAAKQSAGTSIKLGLQETEHHLECKLENEWTIQCVKNQTQKITISNQSAL